MPKKNDISLQEMIDCAQRELEMRKKVYPGLIQSGRMKKFEADKERRRMKAIVQKLQFYKLQENGVVTDSTDFGLGAVERYMLKIKQHDIAIQVIFVNGIMHTISDLTAYAALRTEFKMPLPLKHNEFLRYCADHGTYIELEPLQTLRIEQRIAAFKAAFQRQFNTRYTVVPREVAQWNGKYKTIPARTAELDFYMRFQSFPLNGPKTIGDYLMHYSSIGQLMSKEQKVDEFGLPNDFNLKLYNRLAKEDASLWQAYRVKLTQLGYRETTTTKGKIWKKD